ncbi:MAG: molybdopterin-synthase adenylyltransferase MoeB [Desulfovibrio sp.]|jgi:adenylyltransferase/sulfurtransferase|nr:molybdopterin-synthase adenylyltransferase MoeB [Desulfovibrio sp.]
MSVIPDKRLTELTNEEISRYSRHLLLPEVNIGGQKRLKAAKVLIVGAGGLGSPLGLYLAAAGVGTIGIVDFDVVEASNLQRQIIHSTKDVDRPKIFSAKDRIRGLNPHVEVAIYQTALTSQNALEILHNYDVVVDGTDNYQTRYLVNDACVLLQIPNVYGSIFQFEGQATIFSAEDGPCYRCLYPAPPPPGLVPSCAEGGVIGVLPGIVGCIQACEAIKLIIGDGSSLVGRLLLFDAWRMKFRELKIEKDLDCPICGERPTINELVDYEQFCGLKREEEPVDDISAVDLKELIDQGDPLQIIDVREMLERTIFAFPGAVPIPFGQIVQRRNEIDSSVKAVFICKVGKRSAHAIRVLRAAGYEGKMLNLQDGVNAWARDVDTSLPQY